MVQFPGRATAHVGSQSAGPTYEFSTGGMSLRAQPTDACWLFTPGVWHWPHRRVNYCGYGANYESDRHSKRTRGLEDLRQRGGDGNTASFSGGVCRVEKD